jgi:DNA-binding response OmpR family regulator
MGAMVFVVDPVQERRSIVQFGLERAGYTVAVFATTRALDAAREQRPAVIIVATDLPDGNGIDLCRQIKHDPSLATTRVVLLAESKADRYRAMGDPVADECVTVPLAPGEIACVIEAVVKSRHVGDPRPLSAAGITINPSAMRVLVRGKEVPTTTLEFRLLDYMARNQGKVFTRDALLDAVWGDLHFVTPRSVDACIRRIRKKIERNSSTPIFLKTIRGIGYRLDAKAVWETTTQSCNCAVCSATRLQLGAGAVEQAKTVEHAKTTVSNV